MVKTKSIHTKVEATDGLRILAARFRGRGVPSSLYHVWMPNLGPSEKLLKAVLADEIAWKEFSKRYRDELFADGGIDDSNATIKNHGQKFTLRLLQHLAKDQTVTLLCHCAEDAQQCHRYLLQTLLSKKI
jgi:uncharacterized protein YeaO (DUF488 family)